VRTLGSIGSEPKRGDMVVFRLKDGETDYILRLVGLPGDSIQMINGALNINGELVSVSVRRTSWMSKMTRAAGE
jgi:signal peptidase I